MLAQQVADLHTIPAESSSRVQAEALPLELSSVCLGGALQKCKETHWCRQTEHTEIAYPHPEFDVKIQQKNRSEKMRNVIC